MAGGGRANDDQHHLCDNKIKYRMNEWGDLKRDVYFDYFD